MADVIGSLHWAKLVNQTQLSARDAASTYHQGISNMTTLPDPGVYHILHYGTHGHHQILTVDKNRNVTISAAGTAVASDQEVHLAFWQSLWSFTDQPQPFPIVEAWNQGGQGRHSAPCR